MATDKISQETLDQIKDQIFANINPTLNDIISQALANGLASIPQPSPSPTPEPSSPPRSPSAAEPPTYTPEPSLPPLPPSAANPDIGTAHWIWTQELLYSQTLDGPRAFRKVAVIPSRQLVDSMIIDITCDNFYTLYVNGCVVGSGTDWNVVHRYSIKFDPTNRIVVAVYAANNPVLPKQAGLIASAVTWNSENYQGRMFTIGADASWQTSVTATASGFESPNYTPDSSWTRAHVEAPYGKPPWNAVTKPTTTNSVTEGFYGVPGLPNPPFAPLATSGPDTEGKTAL